MCQCRQHFPRRYRLLTPADFKWVFAKPHKNNKKVFIVYSRVNEGNTHRLGMAFSKKAVRKSVERNRLKRICRESFRMHRFGVRGIDIILLARQGLDHKSNQQLRLILDSVWRGLSVDEKDSN